MLWMDKDKEYLSLCPELSKFLDSRCNDILKVHYSWIFPNLPLFIFNRNLKTTAIFKVFILITFGVSPKV